MGSSQDSGFRRGHPRLFQGSRGSVARQPRRTRRHMRNGREALELGRPVIGKLIDKHPPVVSSPSRAGRRVRVTSGTASDDPSTSALFPARPPSEYLFVVKSLFSVL